jgi:His-Xaa-Ser system protein HxsD
VLALSCPHHCKGEIVSFASQCESEVFEFDLTLYRLSAIKKAAYRFTDGFIVHFEQPDVSKVRVSLTPKVDVSSPRLSAKLFENEVIDQELRETVAEETKGVRELLLAQAFSGIQLVDPVGENADYREDPLQISGHGGPLK